MTRKGKGSQPRFCLVDLETLVPEDHPLRAIQKMIDFSFIYEEVEPYYKPTGRPSIDPVLLLKMLLLGYLQGIPSERRLEQEVRVNIAYRWFLGLELDDPVPDHSTFSYTRKKRFAQADVFQKLFDRIVASCIEQGLVTGEVVVTDSTHIKANVSSSKKSTSTIVVKQTPQAYIQELEQTATAIDKQLPGGERRPERKARVKKSETVQVSQTDPDAGMMNRKNKPRGFHYLEHNTLDPTHRIIVDVHLTPGNVNDHVPCIERLERIEERFGLEIQEFAADSGYDEGHVHHSLAALGIDGYIPHFKRRADAKTFTSEQFHYVLQSDYFVCPAGNVLKPVRVSQGTLQKVYAANQKDCSTCLLRDRCVPATARVKHVTRPIWQEDAERTYQRIGTHRYKAMQRLRRTWCEGTFGLKKRCHGLTRARMRGKGKVLEQALMTAIGINLKRMAKAWKRIVEQKQTQPQVPGGRLTVRWHSFVLLGAPGV